MDKQTNNKYRKLTQEEHETIEFHLVEALSSVSYGLSSDQFDYDLYSQFPSYVEKIVYFNNVKIILVYNSMIESVHETKWCEGAQVLVHPIML